MVGRIRAVGGWVRVGETVKNTLKGSGAENRGGETKIFKRRGQAGSRDGCLKKGECLEPPYELWAEEITSII